MVCALALTALHFFWITAHLAPAIMSPDANGYVVQARLLAEEGRTWFATDSPVQFVGMHWLETTDGIFHSRYPAGLPLLFAAAWKIGGLNALLLVNPALASATVLLVFFLARRLVPEPYALFAALVTATVPVTNQHALDADAHVAAAFLLVAGCLALLRFGETKAIRPGLAAGVLLGAVPAVRYPEALAGVAIGAWLLWRVRPWWRIWPAVAGAAAALVPLLAHNAAAYGAFWRTGYALTNEQTGFGAGYFAAHLLPYLQALGGPGIALMFGFGVAGLAALAADSRHRAAGVLFAGIAVPLVLLYMAYYFGGDNAGAAAGNLRFLIPTFPFFAVAGSWLLARLADQPGPAGRVGFTAVATVQLIAGLGSSEVVLVEMKRSLGAAARVRTVAERQFPPGSVVVVERQLAESLDATGNWKLVEENVLLGFGTGTAGGPPGFAGAERPVRGEGGADAPSPRQEGKNRRQLERYAGLSVAERRERAWADLVAWADGRSIHWIARSLDLLDAELPAGVDYRTLASLDAPTMTGPGGARGGPGPGSGGAGRFGPRGGRPDGVAAGGGRPGGGSFGPGREGGPEGSRGRGAFPGAAGARLHVVRIELPSR